MSNVPANEIRLAELIGALSQALDMTEGQPRGHCIRVCWIGFNLGKAIGYSADELSDLYYTLLLKDLGCSSNAARICQLYLTDDQAFKRDFKLMNGSLPQALRFVLGHTGLTASTADRFRAIDQSSQIALLAQVADVFYMANGRDAAMREIEARSTTWFDPTLVDVFAALADDDAFWATLAAPDLKAQVIALEPQDLHRTADEDYLDDIAQAFAKVIDAKSPFTSGHSERVALYTDLIAENLGETRPNRRKFRRAALLHDIGKLGISNTILDKSSKLEADELLVMRQHPVFSRDILASLPVFADMAQVGLCHHEKLDGSGYPYGLSGSQISRATRIVTVADIFDALSAARPYRPALPLPQVFAIMAADAGTALDADCFAALTRSMQKAAA